MVPSLAAGRSGTKKVLFILLGVALVVHLLSDIGVYALRPQSISTTPDPLDYRVAALNLLHYGEFSFSPPEYHAPQLLRTPVYPALLATTYTLDHETGLVIIVLQSFLLVVMGWLLFRLMQTFDISDNIALALTAIYLFEPLQWLYTLHTMTETLASFLVLALATAALVGKGISDWRRAVLFGVGLGLLILEKPSTMMWAPLLLALVLVAAGEWRSRFGRVALAAFLCIATLIPWMIRNYQQTGYPGIVSSSSAYALIFMYDGLPDIAPGAYPNNRAPAAFWKVVKMLEYNGRSNQAWYAYTANAYPVLVQMQRNIAAHLDYRAFVWHQIACTGQVWFGNAYGDETGHEYDLIASFIFGPNPARSYVLSVVDIALWSSALVLTVLGGTLLLQDSARRWRFLPLLGMLIATVFVNTCASWVRMLLPVYPAIFVAIGAGIAFLLRRTRISAA